MHQLRAVPQRFNFATVTFSPFNNKGMPGVYDIATQIPNPLQVYMEPNPFPTPTALEVMVCFYFP